MIARGASASDEVRGLVSLECSNVTSTQNLVLTRFKLYIENLTCAQIHPSNPFQTSFALGVHKRKSELLRNGLCSSFYVDLGSWISDVYTYLTCVDVFRALGAGNNCELTTWSGLKITKIAKSVAQLVWNLGTPN